MNVKYRIYEKFFSKQIFKKNFKTKIFITKIYNNIIKCDIIFTLLAPFDETGRKNEKVFDIRTRHSFKIGSFTLALHARNVPISTKSGEKIYHGLRAVGNSPATFLGSICSIDDHEILVQGLPLRFSAKQLVTK